MKFSHWFVLLITLSSSYTWAQQQANIWHFGVEAGLDFSSGLPTSFRSNIYAFEGSASYCDEQGSLLFYTNGGGRDSIATGQPSGKVWDRNGNVMYYMGNREGGGYSSGQSALVLPKPGVENTYYIFTMEEVEAGTIDPVPGEPEGRGWRYFEVDMNRNNGLGEVTVANVELFSPSFEVLSGTIHANEQHYWVYALNTVEEDNPRLMRVLVDGSDLASEDVQEQLIPVVPNISNRTMKIAPNGSWLAGGSGLFPLDNSTGLVGDPILFNSTSIIAFTADSRYCYGLERAVGMELIVRFDLEAPDIPSSREVIFEDNLLAGLTQFQLGPDYNLYFVRINFAAPGEIGLGQIACPSAPEPTVEPELFTYTATDNDVNYFFAGLPNFADHIFAIPEEEFPVQRDTFVLCEQTSIELMADQLGNSYQWSTGETTQTIEVSDPGQFNVVVVDDCARTWRAEFVVTEERPTINVNWENEATFCTDQVAILTAISSTEDPVQWSTGESTPQIMVTNSGDYSVQLLGVCPVVSEIVAVDFSICPDCPPLLPRKDTLSWCPGDTILLETIYVGNATQVWSTGEELDEILVTMPGAYAVTITNTCGEQAVTDFLVEDLTPATTINWVNAETYCVDGLGLLELVDLPDMATILWSTGEMTPSIMLAESDSIQATVTVSDACAVQLGPLVIDFDDCERCEVFFPDFISPNEDNINDSFKAFTNCPIEQFDLSIYSRWGQNVFTTKDPTQEWRGEVNDKATPADVYIYSVSYQLQGEELQQRQGQLTVVR